MKNKKNASSFLRRAWIFGAKFSFLLTILFSFPFLSAHAQEADLESLVEQLQQRIENIEQKTAVLEHQITVTPTVFTQMLRRGMRNEQVKALQEFFKLFPDIYPEGLVTGFFGSLTENAVKRFQTKAGVVSVEISDSVLRIG